MLLPSTSYRTSAFIAAARRIDMDLTVASDFPSTFETAHPDALVTFDFANPTLAVEQARAFHARYPVSAVVGMDDDTAALAAVIAPALGLAGNPVAATDAARDKHRQRELFAAAGVPIPAFSLHRLSDDPDAVAAKAPYPCVLKPLRLAASRGVIRADSPEQFMTARARLAAILAQPDAAACGEPARQYLVEEFIPGVEVAVEGLVEHGHLHVLALFDKPDPLDGPYFEESIYVTPTRLSADVRTAIEDCAARAVRALGIERGPVHAEVRWNKRGAWLIEIAARPIGGRCSAVLRFGPDLMSLEELLLRRALDLPVPSLEREQTASGVMMIPVPGAGTLKSVKGREEAAQVPGVVEVVITAHPGERLVPWPEGARYPGFIFARGSTGAAVERSLREAHRRLAFELER
ncbi:MAG TPA: ATP-grasp domain-containing protein [Gemmatimonadales bacterium]|nr:ATP-grasp domain-containing protein [Gemmatimonadales bacterium]